MESYLIDNLKVINEEYKVNEQSLMNKIIDRVSGDISKGKINICDHKNNEITVFVYLEILITF